LEPSTLSSSIDTNHYPFNLELLSFGCSVTYCHPLSIDRNLRLEWNTHRPLFTVQKFAHSPSCNRRVPGWVSATVRFRVVFAIPEILVRRVVAGLPQELAGHRCVIRDRGGTDLDIVLLPAKSAVLQYVGLSSRKMQVAGVLGTGHEVCLRGDSRHRQHQPRARNNKEKSCSRHR